MSKTDTHAIDAMANAIREVIWVPNCKGDDPGTWDQISDDAKFTWRKCAREAAAAADAAGFVIARKLTLTSNIAPLPWSVDRASKGLVWTDSIAISDANGGHVAHLTRGYEGGEHGDGGPSLANAKLIVNAVNALSAHQDSKP